MSEETNKDLVKDLKENLDSNNLEEKTETVLDVKAKKALKKEEKKRKKAEKAKKPYTKARKIRRTAIGVFLLYISLVMMLTFIWSNYAFTEITVENIMFQLKVPVAGTEMSSFMDIIIVDTLGALAGALILTLLYKLIVVIINKIRKKQFKFNYKWFPRACGVVCFIMFIVIADLLGVFTYIKNQFSSTKLYDKYYVDPKYTEITFPEEKRNLVYIMLESMEISFTDEKSGGMAGDKNYLPKLTQLSFENDNFSAPGSTTLNGPISNLNTEWTVASYIAQTTGVPMSVPIERNAMNDRVSFMPGAYSSFQILQKNGYNQSLIFGSDESFSGMDIFIKSHGKCKVKGYNYYNDNGKLPYKGYRVWWGFEDRKLFQFAREEILELAKEDKPFSVSLMTIDTHRTGGYKCPLCKSENYYQYSDVLTCSDNQVANFVEWVRSQEFGDNTTIVIVGDHPTMDGDYVYHLPDYSDEYTRKQYFTIINSAVEPELKTTREYTTVDIFPTFLAALGAEIKGNKLGLGVNLYSKEQTLVEKLGLEYLNGEIAKNSKYYEKYILYGDYTK